MIKKLPLTTATSAYDDVPATSKLFWKPRPIRTLVRNSEETELSMQERFRYDKADPNAYKAMLALSLAVEKTSLTPQLIDLINYRVSQLNGCAFCLDMHSKDLRARGETEQRIYMISAWREAPHLYSGRECAALAWAEAVTQLPNQQVSDATYDTACKEFNEAELTQLTLAIVAINAWNRFNVAFHMPAGGYKSVRKTVEASHKNEPRERGR